VDFQPVLGALFDQQLDQRLPAGLVDCFGQQGPIAVVVKTFVLLTHTTPPRNFSGPSVYQAAEQCNSLLRACLLCSASLPPGRRNGRR
jgi:hypothetical protein